VADDELSALRQAAQGEPGQAVWPGLFPRSPAKLARLLLAARGELPAALLTQAATQYGGDDKRGPREARRYDAHDALACALVHPAIAADSRAALVAAILPPVHARRGGRSRKKSWAIVRWAEASGYLDRDRLPPWIAACLPKPPSGREQALPFPSQPRGPDGALACFAACWPRFRSHLAREREHDTWLDYPGIAELGHRHFAAFASGCRAPFVQGVFDAIEHVLTHGDDGAQNLVVVGLFEAVQGAAYRAEAAGDRYEARLEKNSRQAWAELIEGWTGAGIRDLAAWRQKGRSGPASTG
jgi:hypothetical protein